MARPSEFTIEQAELICAAIAEGKSLRNASTDIADPSTVCRWLSQQPEFRERYMRARELRADMRHEAMSDVVQDMREGLIDHQQARVEIDTLKWQASKELPTRYGDKTALEHSGPDGGAIKSEHVIVFVNPAPSE